MERKWEDEFFELMDEHTPDAPRHIRIAFVESTEPLEINLDGLLYEKMRGEVLINANLLKTKQDKVIITPEFDPQFEAVVEKPSPLKTGDRVAVVHMEGSQQILVLCRVV